MRTDHQFMLIDHQPPEFLLSTCTCFEKQFITFHYYSMSIQNGRIWLQYLYIQDHKHMDNRIWEGELAGVEALLQDLVEPPWLHMEGEGTWHGP